MYRLQIASDIPRDGLGLELLDDAGVIAEVFRADSDHTVTVNVFRNETPLDVFEEFIRQARTQLDPFEDGTRLDVARNFGRFRPE